MVSGLPPRVLWGREKLRCLQMQAGRGSYYHKDTGDKQRVGTGRDCAHASLHVSPVVRSCTVTLEN